MARLVEIVVFTRDRHPANHCSFAASGGPWPVHCVDGTAGFRFHPSLPVPEGSIIVDKGTKVDEDNFDGFHDTRLGEVLRERGVRRALIAGVATEHCVRATALGAVREGFETWLLVDAIAGVDAAPGDGEKAILEMRASGVELTQSGQMATILAFQHMKSALVVVDMQTDFFPGGPLAVEGAPSLIEPISRLLDGPATRGRR